MISTNCHSEPLSFRFIESTDNGDGSYDDFVPTPVSSMRNVYGGSNGSGFVAPTPPILPVQTSMASGSNDSIPNAMLYGSGSTMDTMQSVDSKKTQDMIPVQVKPKQFCRPM